MQDTAIALAIALPEALKLAHFRAAGGNAPHMLAIEFPSPDFRSPGSAICAGENCREGNCGAISVCRCEKIWIEIGGRCDFWFLDL